MAIRTNLLTNPSSENNASGWNNVNSSTLSSSADRAWVGAKSQKVVFNATQAVNQSGTGISNLTLSTLTTYTFSAYVYVPSGNPHIQLQAHQSPTGVFATGTTTTAFDTWQRLTLTFTTTSDAARLYFYLLNQSTTAAGQLFYMDGAMLETASSAGTYFDGDTLPAGGFYYDWTGTPHASTSTETAGVRPRTNLSTNPSVEANTTGFTFFTVTGARSTDHAFSGTQSLKVTHTGANAQYGAGVNHALSVTGGVTYTFSVYAWVPTGQQPVVLQVQKTSEVSSVGTATTVYDQWERLTVTFTAGSSGTANFFILNNTTSANGKFYYADGWLIEKGPSLGPYFDGNTVKAGYSYTWSGTANNSTSTEVSNASSISSALGGSATLTSSLAYTKRVSSALSGSATLTSSLQRNINSQLSGSATLTTRLSGYQKISSPLSATVTLTSVLGDKHLASNFSSSVTLTSSLHRNIASALSGSVTLTSALTGIQRFQSDLSASVTLTSHFGALPKQITSSLGGEVVLYSELGYVVKPAPLGTAPLGKLASFNVSTSATPLNPAEGASGAPSVTAGYIKGLNTEFALGETNVLSHGAVGTYEGEIVRLSLPEGSDVASISQDTILTLLNNELNLFPFIDAAPSTWTAARVIDYWSQQAGLFYDKVPGDCIAYASGYGHTDAYGAGTTARFYEKLAGGTTATQVLNGRSVKTFGSAVVGTTAFHELSEANVPVSVPRDRKFVASAGIGLRGSGRSAFVSWNLLDGRKTAHGVVIKATSDGSITTYIGGVPTVSASVPANDNYRVTFSMEPVSATSVVTKLTVHTDDLDGGGALVYASKAEGFSYALPAVLHLTSMEHTSEGGSGAEMVRWGTYLSVAKAHPMELPVVQKAFSQTRREFGFVSGFTGNVWSNLNEYCAITRQDVAFLDSKLTIAPRSSQLTVPRGTFSKLSRDSERRDKYKQVAVVNKQSKAVSTNDAVFWRADSVFQVAKREVFETTVQTGHSILSLVQPQAVTGIWPFPYKQGGGQYVVTGADGYIIAPEWWADNGGKVEVSLTGKEGEIAIKITAPVIDTVRAPYRISEGADDRPALYIAGSGILNDPKEVHVGTGAKNAKEGFDNVFESPFIAGPMETYDTAAAMAAQYSASVADVSFELPNDFYTPSRFGQFPAGARFTDGKQVYRIKDASQTHNKVSGNAVPNTTIGEYVASYPAGATIADEKARHFGRTIKQFNISPLRGSNG